MGTLDQILDVGGVARKARPLSAAGDLLKNKFLLLSFPYIFVTVISDSQLSKIFRDTMVLGIVRKSFGPCVIRCNGRGRYLRGNLGQLGSGVGTRLP